MDLDTFLSQRDISNADFAEKIGRTAVTVGRWRTARRFPGPDDLALIAIATGGEVSADDMVAHFNRARSEAAGSQIEEAA